jgi:hypothetical protein
VEKVESFLPLIETAFGPVLKSYGFRVKSATRATPEFLADALVYEKGDRSITVCYAQTREQWCEVTIRGYGVPHPVEDLFSFVQGIGGSEQAYVDTNEPSAFAREAERCCNLLVEFCGEFLRGDIAAFRRRYRELFLAAIVRNLRYNAIAQHRWEDIERYHSWLADYWTAGDLKEAEEARDLQRRFG